ncbi:unnamed protein product [Urochloa decumbens]|uniref:Serine/threonine-protein phosphatase n=1 Tax=Urochloa decumbens TaxID=240449 RepID=A0ABC9H0S6_9POAL
METRSGQSQPRRHVSRRAQGNEKESSQNPQRQPPPASPQPTTSPRPRPEPSPPPSSRFPKRNPSKSPAAKEGKKPRKQITGDPPDAPTPALAHALSQPGAADADAAAAMDPSPSPSPSAPLAPPVVEWPEGGALTRDWVAGLESALDWSSRHLPADRLPEVLPSALVQRLVLAAAAILHREPNLVRVDPGPAQSVVVVGDVHGQLHDVMFLLRDAGFPSEERVFVFNGDYVDRGAWGLETLLLLLAWKVLHPNCVFLLRGNHESKYCTSVYGFEQELIIRSHEGPDARDKRHDLLGMDKGYTIDHDVECGKLITLFSAPDYPQFQASEERYNNYGAYIVLNPPDYATPVFHSFEAVKPRPPAHPFYDFEEVIDSDEELNLDAMDSSSGALSQ